MIDATNFKVNFKIIVDIFNQFTNWIDIGKKLVCSSFTEVYSAFIIKVIWAPIKKFKSENRYDTKPGMVPEDMCMASCREELQRR